MLPTGGTSFIFRHGSWNWIAPEADCEAQRTLPRKARVADVRVHVSPFRRNDLAGLTSSAVWQHDRVRFPIRLHISSAVVIG